MDVAGLPWNLATTMTFDEYWESRGSRQYAATHEERARMAWNACVLNEFFNHVVKDCCEHYQKRTGKMPEAIIIDGKRYTIWTANIPT